MVKMINIILVFNMYCLEPRTEGMTMNEHVPSIVWLIDEFLTVKYLSDFSW